MEKERALEIVRKRYAPDGVDDTLRIALETLIPELTESEDERIRKEIYFFLKAEFDEFGGEVVKPEYSRVQKWFAWLEKQKEQKPVDTSDDELQRHQDELYDFKVFAAKQAKEHHISFVHDFEWNNFCAEILTYFNEEQKSTWSEEDEKVIEAACALLCEYAGYYKEKDMEAKDLQLFKLSQRLKSLRPSWKPSEEQMKALHNFAYTNFFGDGDCEALRSLYEDLKKQI